MDDAGYPGKVYSNVVILTWMAGVVCVKATFCSPGYLFYLQGFYFEGSLLHVCWAGMM